MYVIKKRLLVIFSVLFAVPLSFIMGQFASEVILPEGNMVNYDSLQSPDAEAALASTIKSSDIKKHIFQIASDNFEGRELGAPGNTLAGEYIASQLDDFGLEGKGAESSFFQSVAFTYTKWQDIQLSINDNSYNHMKDFVSFPDMNTSFSTPEVDEEIVFMGYGIQSSKYDDYTKPSLVKGKTIVIYRGEPVDADGISLITGTAEKSEWSKDINKKLMLAKQMGVQKVLIVDDSLQFRISERRRELLGAKMTLGEPQDRSHLANSMFISTDILRDIAGKKYRKFIKRRDRIIKKGKSKPLVFPSRIESLQKINTNTVYGRNVVGYIEGSDPLLKDEVLIISAHYDHIGRKGDDINNGADDNASGTTAVLEIAQAFAQAKKEGLGPKRSVLFILLTGEEKGLLGSEYYADHPLIPIENSIANINIDMVGRITPDYEGNPHYIYVIGSDRLSQDLHDINVEKNQQYVRLALDHKFNSEQDPNRFYFRSDHYNFAKKGIPAIFFFNGTHADYHRPSDTSEKIDLDALEARARHIFHLAWELTNRSERIRLKG